MSTPGVELLVAVLVLLGSGGAVEFYRRKKTAAEARLNDAQAALADAQSKHLDAETESLAVRTIREALEEVRELSRGKDQQLSDLRAEMGRQDERHESQMTTVRDEVRELRAAADEVRVLLAAHGQWDLLVVAEVRIQRPDFPDPPPLARLDPDMPAHPLNRGDDR